MLKIIFTFCFFSIINSNYSSAQLESYFYLNNDNSDFKIISSIEGYKVFSEKFEKFEDSQSLKNFISKNNLEISNELTDFDFDNHTLLFYPVHGVDCHSKFKFDYEINDELKTVFIKNSTIYGGCRAGGRRFKLWVQIPKLKSDYELLFVKRIIDEIHSEQTEFSLDTF